MATRSLGPGQGLMRHRDGHQTVEDRLWRTIGSSQARDGKHMERYWRDLSTYWNSPNNGYRELFAVGYAQGRWADLLAEQ